MSREEIIKRKEFALKNRLATIHLINAELEGYDLAVKEIREWLFSLKENKKLSLLYRQAIYETIDDFDIKFEVE